MARKHLAALIAVVTVAGAGGLSSTASAKDPQASGERTETATYSVASGFLVASTDGSVQLGTNWAVFETRKGERYLTLSIDDSTGLPVVGRVWGAGGQRGHTFCSSTDKPIRIRPWQTIYVGAYLGQCSDGTVSIVTNGTITATFSD